MRLLSHILGKPKTTPKQALSLTAGVPLSQTPGVLFARSQSGSGAVVDPESALSLSAVFAGVMLLSRVVATLPLGVFRRTRQWGRDARVPATSNPSHWILGTEFNPEMSAVIGRRVMDFHRLLWGNGYGKIAWDGAGRAAAIWPVEPWRVKHRRDDDGRLYYELDGERIDPSDMLHLPLVSSDGVRGRSFIDYAFDSLGMSLSAQDFASRFFGNDASPGVILKHPGTPKKEAREELKRSWNEAHQGPANARKTAVLWGGWEIGDGPMISPEEAQLLESRRFGIEEVARWLNIPPHLLRDLSRSTFSNIEHQGIDFVIYSIGPTLKEWEQEYDRKLLSPPDVYCKHNVNALLRGDHASRASYYNTLFNIGVFDVNEIRDLEDMNPIEGGEAHFVPLNMTTIQRASAPPALPPAAPPPAPAPAAAPALAPEALRDLLAHTLARLGRVEAHALERAAQKPGRLFAWMDEFYPKHEANLYEALAPVLAVAGPDCSGEILAAGWCATSRTAILSAADAPPAEFAAKVSELLAAWETRPASVAREILPCPE